MKIVWAIFEDEELIERGKVDEFFWKGCRFDVFEEGKCPLTIQSNVNHGVLIEDIATALSNAIQTDDNQMFHTYSTSQSYEVIFLGRDIEFRNFDPNTKRRCVGQWFRKLLLLMLSSMLSQNMSTI